MQSAPPINQRIEAEHAARELLQAIVGRDYSDTTLRVAADHLLSFRRQAGDDKAGGPVDAMGRLFAVAQSDTGQARRVANFLLAWHNGDDLGHFPIADLFALDRQIADDIAAVVSYLGQQPTALYPDAFGFRRQVLALLSRWRGIEADD